MQQGTDLLLLMSDQFHYIIPIPPPTTQDIFAAYQTTRQFYQEVHARIELEQYSEWYQLAAERHRQELAQMRSELNIFRWFRRTKG